MTPSRRFHFDRFCLDTASEQVSDGDRPVALKPKAFAVLSELIGRPGELVGKDQLLDAVWPNVSVGDAVLKVAVAEIREALGDDADQPRFIATVHRRGYRFVAPVEVVTTRAAPPSSARRDPGGVFVGRAHALERLDASLAGACSGARTIVLLSGETGIGKTTLVDAFVAQARNADPTLRVARGECLEQYGAGEAYLPLLTALSGLSRADRDEVLPLLRRHAPSWLAQMPWLGIDDAPTAGVAQGRLLLEIVEALEALCAERPLILVLEDLHWSDYSTLDVLSLLARRDQPARLLAVGTYRPVDVVLSGHPLKAVKQDLAARGRCEELALDLLNEVEVAAYLKARLAGAPPDALERLVYSRTDGNPLFMVTLLDMLVARGAVRRGPHGWEMTGAVEDALGVPESLRQAIEKQVERLDADAQRLLEAASVAGMESATDVVAAALDADPDLVEARAETIAASCGLLRAAGAAALPDGGHASRYAFVHSLHRNVLYDRIPTARRMRLHQRIGEHDERRHAGATREVAAELAVHFEAAQDVPRAIRYREEAAAKAGDRYAYREAIDHLERALAMVESAPAGVARDQLELRVHMALAPAVLRADGFGAAAAERSYRRACLLSEHLGATPDLFPALRGLTVFSLARGELKTARGLAERCLDVAERTADPGLRMRAQLVVGTARYYVGEHAAACSHLEHALAAREAANDRPGRRGGEPEVLCLAYLSQALWFLGRPDEALSRSEAARARAAQLDNAPSMFWADHTAALLHQFRREPAAAAARALPAITLAAELELVQWTAWGTLFHGWLAAEEGRFEDGIVAMRRGLAEYRATGAELGRVFFLTLLAEACGRAGRIDEGLAAVDEALDAASARGETYYQPEAYRVRGELRLGHDPEVGEADFRRALESARSQGASALELRAATSLARHLSARNRRSAAHAILAPVLAHFDQGRETADVAEAHALVGALASGPHRRRPTGRRPTAPRR